MTLAAIMAELGRIGLADYPTPKVAGAASALVEAYRDAIKGKQTTTPKPPANVDDVEPAAGRSGFDMRREQF